MKHEINLRKLRSMSMADLKALSEVIEGTNEEMKAAAKVFWQEIENILAEKFADLHTPDPEPQPFDFRAWLVGNGWSPADETTDECPIHLTYFKEYHFDRLELNIEGTENNELICCGVYGNGWLFEKCNIPTTAEEAQTLFKLFRL